MCRILSVPAVGEAATWRGCTGVCNQRLCALGACSASPTRTLGIRTHVTIDLKLAHVIALGLEPYLM